MTAALPSKNDLASIRERDAASAETWFKPFNGPEQFGAAGRAFVDRRWLLAELDHAELALRTIMKATDAGALYENRALHLCAAEGLRLPGAREDE